VRLGTVTLAVALLAGACAGGKGGHGSADTLPAPAPTTTTTAVSYAVPAEIDAVYVARVMQALDHVYGDAIRIMARDRAVTEPFLKHLLAIYTPRQFEVAQEIWVKDLASGLNGLAPSPGDPITTVQSVVSSESACVLAAVAKDFQPTRSIPVKASPQRYVALIPKLDERDPEHLNPTPWTISFDGYVAEPAGAVPEKPCAVS